MKNYKSNKKVMERPAPTGAVGSFWGCSHCGCSNAKGQVCCGDTKQTHKTMYCSTRGE